MLDQIDLIDIYRTLYLKAAGYIFFSSAHGTFSRTDHILGDKSSFGKFKKTEIIPSMYSNHNTMRVEINYREKSIKTINTQSLNMLLNKHWITEEIKEEIKNDLETNDNENTKTKNL